MRQSFYFTYTSTNAQTTSENPIFLGFSEVIYFIPTLGINFVYGLFLPYFSEKSNPIYSEPRIIKVYSLNIAK